MTDGDHYCSYADIRALLMNAAIGTSGARIYSDTALETALDITMDMIHGELDYTTTKVTTAPYVNILRNIQKDLIAMMILQARHFQENNLADAGSVMAFWQTSPTFTYAHLTSLRKIKVRLRGNTVARNFNTQTGNEVETYNYYGDY
jgi:hypothetical protein